MNIRSITNPAPLQRQTFILLISILTTCVVLTMLLDKVEAIFQRSSFYLSESFLFSSFWWLFLPLISAQVFFAKSYKTRSLLVLPALLLTTVHLFAYPAMVWLISKLFYHHTFSYWQTFNYGLTEYTFILLTAYSGSLILYASFDKTPHINQNNYGITGLPKVNDFITTFTVADGNRRTTIDVKDIRFFKANPPYINIHHKTKRYLHHETLKSISSKLDDTVFIRVHKSVIVNIMEVQSYKSRMNGDYDLTMTDGTEVRLSRNYARTFRQHFERRNQDTTK